MFDKLCIYTFFIVLLIQILKVITLKVLQKLSSPPNNIQNSPSNQQQSQQNVSDQRKNTNEALNHTHEDIRQTVSFENQKNEENNGQKGMKQKPSHIQPQVEEQIEDIKVRDSVQQIKQDADIKSPHFQKEGIQNQFKYDISVNSPKNKEVPEITGSVIKHVSLISEGNSVYDEILSIFKENEQLQKEVFRNSKMYKNSMEITDHRKVVGEMKSQLQQLRQELVKTKEKLNNELNIKSIKASQLPKKEKQKIEEEEKLIEVLRRQKQELNRQIKGKKQELSQIISSSIVPESSEELVAANQNLKGQLQFCQSQLIQAYETESELKEKIQKLSESTQQNVELQRLREKMSSLQPIIQNYSVMEKRYYDMKKQLQQSGHKPTYRSSNTSSPSSLSPHYTKQKLQVGNSRISQNSNSRRTSTIHYYRFLADCSFTDQSTKEFIYAQLHKALRGVLKTQLLFRSDPDKVDDNPHPSIDDVKNILLLIELQNGKVLGAYTHEPFSEKYENSPPDNIAFIFDITNRKSFNNISITNTILYNKDSLVWGYNEIMIKFSQPQIMYTNFCRTHNVYWDGQYKIQQFIDSDKQWARINKFQIYRILKI